MGRKILNLLPKPNKIENIQLKFVINGKERERKKISNNGDWIFLHRWLTTCTEQDFSDWNLDEYQKSKYSTRSEEVKMEYIFENDQTLVLKVYWNKFKQVLQFSNQNIQTILPDTQFLFLHYIYHICHSLKNLAPFSAEHFSF